MEWLVRLHQAFDPEFEALPPGIQDELLALLRLLADCGPALGRPHVDTLKGARHRNLKELRLQHRGQPWRFLFAFDRERAAIVLTGGCKAGDGRFYERHLRIADQRFAAHRESLGRPVGGRRRKERT
jgi:hypothetical protein